MSTTAAGRDAAVASPYLAAMHARWLEEEPGRRWREIDGTLLFADVSGFTALGERLARRGRVGTEELLDVLRTVFARMLEPVLVLGGDLIKFGGDAVLIMFEGEEHAARGAAAALAMQDAIRSLRGMHTSAGAVSLRLSAGISSGPLHLFLSGSVFRELVIAGPVSSATCVLEGDAGPGEVLAALPTARAIGLRRTVPEGRPGVPIRTAPAVLARPAPLVALSSDPAAGLPAHLHAHTPGDGEHRTITAAFIQFKGPDTLLEEHGPAALADALDELSSAVQEACARDGVTLVATDVDNDAGKFYLVTGAPTSGSDDEDRMLHAVRSIVGRRWALPVRAGVNRGRAFVVDVGPPERVSWSVMGDTVNLAARVMGKAPIGEVLATPAVLDHARGDFRRTPVEPFKAKGKRQPVQAELVGELRAARRAPVAGRAQDLVGREAEVSALRSALGLARAGGRPVVQLTGEPGIGKTRLLDAAQAEAGDFRVLCVQGGPYSARSPYFALRPALRELIGLAGEERDEEVAGALRAAVERVDPDLAPWLPLIAIPFGLELPATDATRDLSPDFSRGRLRDATSALLDGLLAGPGRLLLTIEDAHWLDEASSDLLAHLVRRLRRTHRATIVTRRPGPGGLDLAGGEQVTALSVQPLDPQAAERLLQDDGIALTPRARDELIDRAAGNPLFLQELVSAARAAGGDLSELPDTVEALLTARIDTLPEADRGLLRRAAVLGVRIESGLLAEMVGLGPAAAEPAIGRLDDFLMPVAPGIFRFRHALARDAAYEALPFRVRRDLHARAAALIEARAGEQADEVAALLSLHYHAAHRWPESWRWSRAAGDLASRKAAVVEAVGFLSAALDAGRRLDRVAEHDLAEVAVALGDAASLAARYEVASNAYREARRHLDGASLETAEVYRKEGRLRERLRHYGQAKRWYTRADRLLDGDERPEAAALRAKVAASRGAAELHQGRLRACVASLGAAVAGAEAAGDRETLAHACYMLDAALTDLGSPEARRYRDRALPIYEELGDHIGQGNVLNNLGVDAYYEGAWEKAVGLYERASAAFERGGDVVHVAAALNNIAEIRSDQGRLQEAVELLRHALDIWEGSGFPAGAAWAKANLGRAAVRRGELARGGELLGAARVALTEVGATAMALEVDAREAERRLLAGDHDGALELTRSIQATGARLGPNHAVTAMLHRIAGSALLAAGETEPARERLAEAVAFARSIDAPYEEGLALDALARAGGPGAGEHRERAGAIFDGLGVLGARRPGPP